jgi:hypothetical protein
LRIPRIGAVKNNHRTIPDQCTQNHVGEGDSLGILEPDAYCPENGCMNTRLHVLHLTGLEAYDVEARERIAAEIDTYIVPCSILQRLNDKKTPVHSSEARIYGFTCMCRPTKPTHTIHISSKISSKGNGSAQLPIEALFLLPQDEMKYTNLPDLGIFIRATMTKKFFASNTMSQHFKVSNLFSSGNKKGMRKKSNNTCKNLPTHWMQSVANSWVVSLLLETIPCLNRYKRGFKHTYDANTVTPIEVHACLQILYGTLLKLYPRGSKTPTFTARVNIVSRVQALMEQTQDEQMTFVTTYPALVKICLMEYCYNVLLDYFPVEYSIVCAHPSMVVYEMTARVMFDTFRRDVITTGLEEWQLMDGKVIS